MNHAGSFILLTRPGCHLCEAYAEELAERFPAVFEALILKPVDERPEWLERYGVRIPVLLAGDRVLGEGIFEADAVGRALAAYSDGFQSVDS